MAQSMISLRFIAAGACLILAVDLSTCQAQLIQAPLDQGFARTSSIAMTVDEMLGVRKDRSIDEPILGPGYPALWIAEVQFKPVRMRRIELPDPKTGEVRLELVRYLVYRIILRDYTDLAGDGRASLEKKLADPDFDPTNVLDPEFLMPLQMPRFLLDTTEKDGTILQTYTDEISVEIQNIVFEREMGRRGRDLKLLNNIEAISEIGEPVSINDPDPLLKAVYGVAVWRNVDPKADFLTVTMSGFSNAYRISGGPDDRVVEEKVIVQKFYRPGDEFLQDEMELRFINEEDTDGDGKIDTRYPAWKYRTKPVRLNIPKLDTVLRNVRESSAADPGN